MPSRGRRAGSVMSWRMIARAALAFLARAAPLVWRLLLEPEPGLEDQLELAGRTAPHRPAPRIVFRLHDLSELAHRRILGRGGRLVQRLRARADRLRGRDVRPLDPATDLVPVLVEEHHDGNRLIAVVQEAIAEVAVLIAQEDPELAVR